MPEVLPEPAATVVASAAFTGARKVNCVGFCGRLDGKQIRITQALWRNTVKQPKSKASKAPVPVITRLRERLDTLRAIQGNPQSGPIFPNSRHKPMCLDKLARDVIRPILEKADVAWYGWHAFRRGLATNLHKLGVQDKVIQAILRHANVSMAQRCYIKVAAPEAVAAMRLLERAPIMHQKAGDARPVTQ